jgi:hypothetical protein
MPHSQLDEAGRAISTASASTIKSAISSIARALVSLKRLASGGTGAATEAAVSQAVTEAEQRLVEARNVAEWFEADIHRDFTLEADGMFGNGCITRDERIALSGAIGAALDAFRTSLTASAPALYQRDLWVEPDDGGGDMGMDEAATVQDVQASELIPLTEGAVRKDGTALIKLIQPGWGSSGYYPAAVLERDGPTVFKTAPKCFGIIQRPPKRSNGLKDHSIVWPASSLKMRGISHLAPLALACTRCRRSLRLTALP